MAELIYGFATSHGPQLSLPPEKWGMRADVDRKRKRNTYRDGVFTFEELAELRRADREYFLDLCRPEAMKAHYDRSQAALNKLADQFAAMKPDALIVIGDDQSEWFSGDNQPAISILCGKEVLNRKYDRSEFTGPETGNEIAATGWRPPQDQIYPLETGLALHVIKQAIEDEFDVSVCTESPVDEKGPKTVNHSIGYIVRRILRDKPVPLVPVLLNTFYPPNQIKPGRCLDLGKSIGKAVRSWGANKRVAICASGAMSHYVVDEPWDKKMLDAMLKGDEQTMRNEPNAMFQGGTSEAKNWITVCGAMSGANFRMNLIDYVPCYRSEAGTGNAMTFATWETA